MVIDLRDKIVHITTQNEHVIHSNHDVITNVLYKVYFAYVMEIFIWRITLFHLFYFAPIPIITISVRDNTNIDVN